MGLQFSAWLRGNKAHFHFHRSAVRVQSSSNMLFSQAGALHIAGLFSLVFAVVMVNVDDYTWYDASR